MSTIHRLTIFADYFQFIVMDVASNEDFSTLWTDEALERMVAVGDSALSLGTLRNVNVQIEIHIVDALPNPAPDEYDHIVAGALKAPTGALAVMGCTGFLPDAYRVDLAPGNYQFLYLVSGVSSITDEWSPADDLYILYLTPGAERLPTLVKHWNSKTESAPSS